MVEQQSIEQNMEDRRMDNPPRKHGPRAWSPVWLQVIVAAWAFSAFYIYTMQVIMPGYKSASVLYDEILSRTAAAPYAYRLLVPYLIKWLGVPFSKFAAPLNVFFWGYVTYSLLAIEFSALVLFRMLRLWFDALLSIVGIAMFCLMVAVAAHYDVFQPWSQLEPGLYAAAIILAVRRRGWWALLLTIIATLNRETGLFVALLFGCALSGPWFDRKRICWTAVLVAAWFAVFWGLRQTIGMVADRYTVEYCWDQNLVSFSINTTLTASAAFFAVMLPAVFSKGRIPSEIRRCSLILVLYVPLVTLFGLWWEVRHWLPIACILLPLAVGGVQALLTQRAALPEAVGQT